MNIEDVREGAQGHQSDAKAAGGRNIIGFVRQPWRRHGEHVGQGYSVPVMHSNQVPIEHLKLDVAGRNVVGILDDLSKSLEAIT
jgi:hypothetical protein